MPETSDTSVVRERSSNASQRKRGDPLLIQLGDSIQPVERRDLVALRQRGIVEDRVHEVFEPASERHHRLPDVQQLARTLTDDVHAKDGVVLAVEDQLETSGRVAANLAT